MIALLSFLGFFFLGGILIPYFQIDDNFYCEHCDYNTVYYDRYLKHSKEHGK